MMKRLPILFLFFSFGCSKQDEIAPRISITAPEQKQVSPANQNMTITATVADNTGIHMIHLIIVDDTGGHWVYSEDHVDGKLTK